MCATLRMRKKRTIRRNLRFGRSADADRVELLSDNATGKNGAELSCCWMSALACLLTVGDGLAQL